ncbi:MAG: hypothetical protein Q7T80_14835 [Methanoregula sp.]|nr:hypothetical protein [Methanoregula sp.]
MFDRIKQILKSIIKLIVDFLDPYLDLIHLIFPFLIPVGIIFTNVQILSWLFQDEVLRTTILHLATYLLIFSAFLLIITGILKYYKSERVVELKKQISDKESKISNLEKRNVELNEENIDLVMICDDIIDSLLTSIATGPLAFGETGENNERISIYIYDEEMEYFTQLGRFSQNAKYNHLGRKFYPKDQGCIGLTWQHGSYFANNYLNPETHLEEYAIQMKDERIPKLVTRNMIMKSRLYYGYKIMDTRKSGHLAVIIVESTDPQRYTEEQLRKVFTNEHRALFISRIIEKLNSCIPRLMDAKKEGF